MERLGRPAGALALIASVATAAAAVSTVDEQHWWLGTAIALAILSGTAPLLLALVSPTPRMSTTTETEEDPADFTTFVRIGDEPVEIARSTVALARRAGPTVIVTDMRDLPDDLVEAADRVFRAETTTAAIQQAAVATTTDGVLMVSARSVPEADACRRASGLLDEEVGWVVGSSRPFNRDRYASDGRETLDSALRRRAGGCGVALWTNDATMVRTDLLAQHIIEPGRVWGSWLRDRQSEGLDGLQIDDSLSVRAAPVAADSYWPDSLARQRAAAVDVAGAVGSGPVKARFSALLLLARELYAYPLLVWLLLPALMGPTFAFSVSPWIGALALCTTAVARWWSLHAICGVKAAARPDTLAAVYHAPGSLAAAGAVARRRITPVRTKQANRPLVWGALALTAIAGFGLLNNEPGEPASRVAIALSLLLLGGLWALTIRSLVERNWSRTSYRVRLSRPATVNGTGARTLDGSPGGVAVLGRFPIDEYPSGTEVMVAIELDDEQTIEAPGVIAARRRRRGSDLLGLELHAGTDALDAWSAQLLRAADHTDKGRTSAVALARGSSQSRSGRYLDRLLIAAVVGMSVAVLGGLVLVLLGFRPLVVRSGSMVPTYQVGDVVMVEQIHADGLRPGDVVSLEYYPDFGESMTHRVRSARRVGDRIEVETRGDANERSEVWSVAAGTSVGRVVARIPAIGTPATMVRTATGPAVLGVTGVVVIIAMVMRGQRGRPQEPSRRPSRDRSAQRTSSQVP